MRVELKRISTMLLVMLFVILTGATAQAENKVLTIYCAGTGNTVDGALVLGLYKYDQELLSSIYNNDTSSTDLSGDGPKYKFFVDGVGTHSCLASVADPMETCILPTCCRGFEECLDDAIGAFNAVGDSADLILNLVGYSRGGVLPMIMARWVSDQNRTVKKINILAFDPVPGVTTSVFFGDPIGRMGDDLTLPDIVNQYVGVYARDERSIKFEPVIPEYDTNIVKDMLVSVRGSHETLVGNLEIDGHSATFLPVTAWMLVRDSRLGNHFKVSWAIAERLLSGSEWGEVNFNPSLFITVDPKQEFISYVNGMYSYPPISYGLMHTVSFLPVPFPFGVYDLSYELLGRDHHILISSPIPPLLHGRLIYRAPYRHAPEYIWWLFPFWWLNPDQVYLLDQYVNPINGENAWARMELLRGEPSSIDDKPPVPADSDLPTVIGQCSVTLTTEPTATDNIDGTIKGTTTDPLSYTEQGTYTVLWTYTDQTGNIATQTQTVLVEDTTPPSLLVPNDATVECTDDTSSASNGVATGSDNCSSVTITENDSTAPGSCGNTTVITRTWTATDANGNSTSADQTITVVDTTAPVFSDVPADVTVECDNVPAVAEPTATDNCDADPEITYSEVRTDGDCPSNYTLTRTWITTDVCGNSSSQTQIITVQDTTAPVIECPADVTLECPADTSIAANGSATGSDTCGSVTITSSDISVEGCGNTDVITRTWTATDECGNSTSCDQTITVQDTTAPSLSVTVNPNNLWPPNHNYVTANVTITVSDTCDDDIADKVQLISVTSDEPEDAAGGGDGNTLNDIVIVDNTTVNLRAERQGGGDGRVYTLNYSVTDDCGNTATASTTVSAPHSKKDLAVNSGVQYTATP